MAMKWDRAFFRSRVAQRIALLFILCALIPITLLAFLTFNQVTRHLQEQSQERLHQTSKAMALSIFERLMFLESELTRIAANTDISSSHLLNTPPPELDDYLEERFKGVAFFDWGRPTPPFFIELRVNDFFSAENKMDYH